MATAMASGEVDRGPPPGGAPHTYAERLKYTRKSNAKLRRNALEIYMEKDEGINVQLDFDFMSKIMAVLEVKNGLETQGNQVFFTPGALWWRYGCMPT